MRAQLQPTAVNTILAEVRALTSEGRPVASLMRGEPDFPTPDHIVEAAMKALREGRTSYPDNRGEPVLRQAVADRLPYDPGTEILITDGATLGIFCALMAVLEPGDEILVPDPVYDAYQSPIRLAGGRARPVRSRRSDGRFTLPADELEAAWTPAAKALLLNTPWNPVGSVFGQAELETICDFVQRRGLALISDEIYETITYEGRRHVSPATLIRDRCIVVNSFSKTYSMTGWRLGYCCAPKETLARMFLVLQQTSRGPATFVQHAGAAALNGSQECVAQMRNEYANRRQLAIDTLSGIDGVEVLAPEGGFFVMLDVSRLGADSNAIRRRLLQDHGVAVVHGSAYGQCGEGTLRVSFASGGETLQRGLQLLQGALESRP